MLPAFIIEQIRQREERERIRDEQQPRLEIPLPMPPIPKGPEVDEEGRGVLILEL